MIEKLKKIINKLFNNGIFIAFLVIPFIKPAPEITGNFDIVFDVLKILSSIFIIIYYFLTNKKLSKIITLIALFELVLLLSTVINSGQIWWASVQVVSVISICMLTELLCKKNKLKLLLIPILTMAILTILTMFITYPNGVYQVVYGDRIETANYLWGFDNSSIFKFISAIVLLMILTNYKKKSSKIITLALLVLTTIAFIYVESITASFACMILLLGYILFMFKTKEYKFINFKFAIIIFIGISSILFIFNKNIGQLQDFAENTNKLGSLNYRFYIWEKSTEEFLKSPIIGYGFEEPEITISKIGLDHPHNIIIDIMYRGGILGIVSFASIIIFLLYTEAKRKKITINDNIIILGILSVLLVSLMDYYNDQYLWFTLIILLTYSNILSKTTDESKVNHKNSVSSKKNDKSIIQKNKMKVVHIESGLGNQMLSFCEYLALKKVNPKEKIYIETIIYEIPEASEYICQWNGYELNKIFNLKIPNIKDLYSEDEWEQIVEEVKKTEFWKKNWNYPVYITQTLNNHGMNLKNIRGDFEDHWELIVPKNKKWPLWFKLKQTVLYSCLRKLYYKYYKNKKYKNDKEMLFYDKKENVFTGQRLTFKNKENGIELIDNDIRKSFIFPKEENEKNILLKKELQSCNSVAIHARRGDMLSYNGKHYRDGYFKRSVKYIKKNVENPVFYFFCDPGSVEWCRKHQKIFGLNFKKDTIKFVNWNKGTESFRDMELMSYCKHNIITYSSFGWWGSYLNKNNNKITISPESYINTTNNF